jgi:hypothetical protein
MVSRYDDPAVNCRTNGSANLVPVTPDNSTFGTNNSEAIHLYPISS